MIDMYKSVCRSVLPIPHPCRWEKRKQTAFAIAFFAAASTIVEAGGLDQSGQPVNILFSETGESGAYVQLSFDYLSSTATGTSGQQTSINNPINSHSGIGAGFKRDINDDVSLSFLYDQPFAADVAYDSGAPFFGGSTEISSNSFALLGRVHTGNGISVHGGLRSLDVEGSIFTIFDGETGTPSPALLEANTDTGFGLVGGISYEIPEIAFLVGLTYSSKTDLTLDGTEATLTEPDPQATAIFQTAINSEITFPESVNIDFRSGIAEDTLLFGSIRWVGWDALVLQTQGNGLVGSGAPRGTSTYVRFAEDRTTYAAGIYHQISERLGLGVMLLHEPEGSKPSTTPLHPTTGYNGISLLASYETEQSFTYTARITMGAPGDQIVENALVNDVNFNDNEFISVNFMVSHAF